MESALPVIEAEHRVLAILLKGLQSSTEELLCARKGRDARLLHSIIRYLVAYPERYHHPKETHHLFGRLRMRTEEFDDVLDRLEREHQVGESRLHMLKSALQSAESSGTKAELESFARIVDELAGFYWEHMRIEEEVVLPAARRLFTEDDWIDLDSAFAGHLDPLVDGSEGEGLRKLLARLEAMQ